MIRITKYSDPTDIKNNQEARGLSVDIDDSKLFTTVAIIGALTIAALIVHHHR